MNAVAMTIINPRKEYWPSRESNHRPPVLKSFTLPTELHGIGAATSLTTSHSSSTITSSAFPKQILDVSKLKEFADDYFKFDGNGRKYSKWVENTVGKGEIVRYEQFLLFPMCFQKTCTADT